MISDTLSDAVYAIRDYQGAFPQMYDQYRPLIDATCAVMDVLRAELDKAPRVPVAWRRESTLLDDTAEEHVVHWTADKPDEFRGRQNELYPWQPLYAD